MQFLVGLRNGEVKNEYRLAKYTAGVVGRLRVAHLGSGIARGLELLL